MKWKMLIHPWQAKWSLKQWNYSLVFVGFEIVRGEIHGEITNYETNNYYGRILVCTGDRFAVNVIECHQSALNMRGNDLETQCMTYDEFCVDQSPHPVTDRYMPVTHVLVCDLSWDFIQLYYETSSASHDVIQYYITTIFKTSLIHHIIRSYRKFIKHSQITLISS